MKRNRVYMAEGKDEKRTPRITTPDLKTANALAAEAFHGGRFVLHAETEADGRARLADETEDITEIANGATSAATPTEDAIKLAEGLLSDMSDELLRRAYGDEACWEGAREASDIIAMQVLLNWKGSTPSVKAATPAATAMVIAASEWSPIPDMQAKSPAWILKSPAVEVTRVFTKSYGDRYIPKHPNDPSRIRHRLSDFASTHENVGTYDIICGMPERWTNAYGRLMDDARRP